MHKKKSQRNSPQKPDLQLKDITSRKIKQPNQPQITITKNDQDAQIQPVLPKSPSAQNLEQLTCPKCNYKGKMNEQFKMGCVSWTWFSCLLLFTIVAFPVTFFCTICKDKIRYCPMCGETVDREFARCL